MLKSRLKANRSKPKNGVRDAPATPMWTKEKMGVSLRLIGIPKISDMENEFMKRGYLLPEGCKDLIHTLKLPIVPKNEGGAQNWFIKVLEAIPQQIPIKGALMIPKKISMGKLAAMLDKEPYPIVCRMMLLGIFPHEILDFETAAVIAKKYGFVAKQAD